VLPPYKHAVKACTAGSGVWCPNMFRNRESTEHSAYDGSNSVVQGLTNADGSVRHPQPANIGLHGHECYQGATRCCKGPTGWPGWHMLEGLLPGTYELVSMQVALEVLPYPARALRAVPPSQLRCTCIDVYSI
jgi:hypothetical protein